MRKLLSLLFLLLPTFFFAQLQAQCTPDMTLSAGQFTPDTLPTAWVQTSYSETFSWAIDHDTTIQGQTVPIDSVAFDCISALPAGINWQCPHPAGIFYPDSIGFGPIFGCMEIYGVPIQCGDYNLTLRQTSYYTWQGAPQFFSETAAVFLHIATPMQAPSFTDSVNGLTGYFTAISNASANNLQWYFGDGNSSIGTNTNHTYAAPGSYQVCLTEIGPCNETATTCDTVNVSVVANSISPSFAGISINSDPLQGKAWVSSEKAPIRFIEVWDIYGHRMQRVTPGNSRTELDIKDFSAGLYLVKVVSMKGDVVVGRVLR